MKEFTLEKSLTHVMYVPQLLGKIIIFKDIKEFTHVRLTYVKYVPKDSMEKMNLKVIRGFTQEKSLTNVKCVRKHLFFCPDLKNIKGFIQMKSLTCVKCVPKDLIN